MRIVYDVCPKCGYEDDAGNGNSCCPFCETEYDGTTVERNVGDDDDDD